MVTILLPLFLMASQPTSRPATTQPAKRTTTRPVNRSRVQQKQEKAPRVYGASEAYKLAINKRKIVGSGFNDMMKVVSIKPIDKEDFRIILKPDDDNELNTNLDLYVEYHVPESKVKFSVDSVLRLSGTITSCKVTKNPKQQKLPGFLPTPIVSQYRVNLIVE